MNPLKRWIQMRLEAPMMSFGGPAVDHIRPVMEFPGASMLTGMLANALGWDRTEHERHQSLQDRLIYGCAVVRKGAVVMDSQNARLSLSDEGWTTRGFPEGRKGSPATYEGPHRMFKDYLADQSVRVVLRLKDEDEAPTLGDLARALRKPARPLSIGRKNCLPTCRLFNGFMMAKNAHAALYVWCHQSEVMDYGLANGPMAMWPEKEGPVPVNDFLGEEGLMDHPDVRNWRTRLHGGGRRVCVGLLAA